MAAASSAETIAGAELAAIQPQPLEEETDLGLRLEDSGCGTLPPAAEDGRSDYQDERAAKFEFLLAGFYRATLVVEKGSEAGLDAPIHAWDAATLPVLPRWSAETLPREGHTRGSARRLGSHPETGRKRDSLANSLL